MLYANTMLFYIRDLNILRFLYSQGGSQNQSPPQICRVVSDSLQPHGLCSPWNSPGQNPGVGQPFPSPGNLPNPGIELRSLALQADSLPVEPQRKPKNTGVGSLSLLQQIFPNQVSNQGLLHCRQILYQLSYQESPQIPKDCIFN